MSNKIIILCMLGFMPNLTSCMSINHDYKDRSRFMSQVADSRLIRNLALIGSYQSAAIKPLDYIRTQNLMISEQLKVGMRVLDIHLRVVGDEMKTYYGPEFLGYTFDDILDEVMKFMTENPQELVVILLSVQFDHTLTNSAKCTVLGGYVARWRQRGLNLVQDWSLLDDSVGEHRGQVLLGHVRESDFASCSVFLPCEVQNNWNVTDREKKWKFIENAQEGMLFAYHPYHSCYINYLASTNPLLFTYSSVPDDAIDNLKLGVKEINEINDKMVDFFRNPYDTLIIIVTEFPSQNLIDKVIDSNFY